MRKYYLGIDLGSTTSKAVIINEEDEIIGRGITNTRANYTVAADIAKMQAIFNARFSFIRNRMKPEMEKHPELDKFLTSLEDAFGFLQFDHRARILLAQMKETADSFLDNDKAQVAIQTLENAFKSMLPQIEAAYLNGDYRNSNQFFRDVIGEKYREYLSEQPDTDIDTMLILYDKSITPVENEMIDFEFGTLIHRGLDLLEEKYNGFSETSYEGESYDFDAEMNLLKGNYKQVSDNIRAHIEDISQQEIGIANMVGTGYGRALLPFPEECIRSEILCHAFGAHAIFPNTRTVLDIGGQDTKAIQVDNKGLVTSFQMNDRCAAGCGRYLGYIADELNISLNELGPLALEAKKEVNICSTCTVFAGAELRELINLGEKREDILSGLHKAIVMRAMSLLARSGGVRNELTFTGGVARNQAVLKFVNEMVLRNYGDEITINYDPDSIFMGALGAAMFANRNLRVNLPEKQKKAKKIAS